MARRFITRTAVDAAVAAGETVLRVGRRDTVTDVAREHAQQRGVRIERTDDDASPHGSDAGGPAAGKQTETTEARASTDPRPPHGRDADRLRREVRRAVVAELGESPAGLDAAIDRVLAAREDTGRRGGTPD